MEKLKAVLYGVGAVGNLLSKLLLEKEGVEIVGAIDTAADKMGKDLGEIIGLDKPLGVIVSDDVKEVMSAARPNIVIHATSSYMMDVVPQLAEVVKYGANIVSTCEELSYPYLSNPKLAEELDKLAKENSVTVLGTGINPGFLMDTLVIFLTTLCQRVDRIAVSRIIDASTRRESFQRKIGAGLSLHEFNETIRTKKITGHVGLAQSISMISAALSWPLEKIGIEAVEPIVAERALSSDFVKVEVGHVAGLRQTAIGYKKNEKAIVLVFQAYIGAEEERDTISIEGFPNVNQTITPCVHGDAGTAAVVVNVIPKVLSMQPGMTTMKDLAITSAVTEDIREYIVKLRS